MAKILQEIISMDGEVVLVAGSDIRRSKDAKTFVFLWNYLLKKGWTLVADFVLNFLGHLVFLPLGEVQDNQDFLEAIHSLDPAILISTADAFNHQLASFAKKRGIPFFLVVTDIAVYYDLVHPFALHVCYLEETKHALQSFELTHPYYESIHEKTTLGAKLSYLLRVYGTFLRRGVRRSMYQKPSPSSLEKNAVTCLVTGPLAEKKHFEKKDAKQLKGKYQIKKDIPTVLLASGSLGGKLLETMVRHLKKKMDIPLNLLVMCGNDQNLYERMQTEKKDHSFVTLYPFPFTSSFDEFLEMADCILIRPSAGVFMECLVKRKPVVTFKRATSNDRGTLHILSTYQVGRICEGYGDLVSSLKDVLEKKVFYEEKIAAFLSRYPSTWEEKQALVKDFLWARQNKEVSHDSDKGSEDKRRQTGVHKASSLTLPRR